MDAWNGVFVCGRMSAENHRPGLIVFFSFQISPCVFCFLRPSAAAGSTAEAAQAEVRCRVQVRRVEIPPLAKHVCLYVRARTLFRVFPFFSSPLLFFSPCFLFCFSFYSLGFEREYPFALASVATVSGAWTVWKLQDRTGQDRDRDQTRTVFPQFATRDDGQRTDFRGNCKMMVEEGKVE